jgi:hypothetical protein
VALETNAALKAIRDSTLLHSHDFDAAHFELWQRVSNYAGIVEGTFQSLNTDLPILAQQLRSMRNQIDENTEMLLVQTYLIKGLLSAGLTEWLMSLLFAIIVLVANLHYPIIVTWVGGFFCKFILTSQAEDKTLTRGRRFYTHLDCPESSFPSH